MPDEFSLISQLSFESESVNPVPSGLEEALEEIRPRAKRRPENRVTSPETALRRVTVCIPDDLYRALYREIVVQRRKQEDAVLKGESSSRVSFSSVLTSVLRKGISRS